MTHDTPFDRKHPFLASIKERYNLCSKGSLKDTRHVTIDLKGSGIAYKAGDSLAVLPINDPILVAHTLKVMKATGDEPVVDRTGASYSLKEFLSSHANLKGITRKTITQLIPRLSASGKMPLEELLKEENKEALKEWLHAHELWDLLEQYPDAHFSPQEVAELVMPLLPRFYSIASSQLAVGDEVHLTVAYLRYHSRGIPRVGVCTHYLCQLAEMHQPIVPVYLHPSTDFRLPEDPDTPTIMIGPGTGVAPFRAFLQEREARGDKGKNWLFFGEWTRAGEFYYSEDFLRWEAMGLLRLDLAFSREFSHKVYVQHLLEEKGADVYRLLEEGATLYVCGDAHHMAKDVDLALHHIIQKHGKKDESEAHTYMKRLRADKRYLRDVY